MKFEHTSVLLEECIQFLNIKPEGIYVDGTLGGAGHARHVCKALSQKGHFIGIDQDDNALAVSKERLQEVLPKVSIVKSNFEYIEEVLLQLGIEKVDGVLLDLGVSSHQLDEAKRGFSYQHNARLDMRMNQEQSFSAYELVNEATEDTLFQTIKTYGEENWAKRIAKFIVQERQESPIETTYDLVEVIKKAIPLKARREGPHPAKRTFQALRIAVNKELDIIEPTILKIVEHLNPKGRLCIITFHSLEDRIVKQTFKRLEHPCTCAREIPICVCGQVPQVKVITRKPILPTEAELALNSRARSAKLRVIEKL